MQRNGVAKKNNKIFFKKSKEIRITLPLRKMIHKRHKLPSQLYFFNTFERIDSMKIIFFVLLNWCVEVLY